MAVTAGERLGHAPRTRILSVALYLVRDLAAVNLRQWNHLAYPFDLAMVASHGHVGAVATHESLCWE